MQARNWSKWAAALVLVLVGWVNACSERGLTEPRFDRPAGTIVGLDRSKRLPPNGDLGGAAAMNVIAASFGPASSMSNDPLERAVAEWREKQSALSGPRASKLWSGVEIYDGDYYVWANGEAYAPIQKQAKIYNLVGQASHWSDSPVEVEVTFTFDGHKASNDAQWTIHRSNGTVLISRPMSPFGSQTDPFFGLTAFARRGWAAHATEQVDGCDLVVDNTQTRAHAWYEAVWDVSGVSIGLNPSGPGVTVNLTKQKRGDAEESTTFNTYFTCPPDNGSGGGGYDGGDDCTICQQWFLPVGDAWIIEWWECTPGAPGDCEAGAVT